MREQEMYGVTSNQVPANHIAALKAWESLVSTCSSMGSSLEIPNSHIVLKVRSSFFSCYAPRLPGSLILNSFPASGLSKLTVETVTSSMQVTPTNPMAGIDGRSSLLSNLAKALEANSVYFGQEGRPGNLIGKRPNSIVSYS